MPHIKLILSIILNHLLIVITSYLLKHIHSFTWGLPEIAVNLVVVHGSRPRLAEAPDMSETVQPLIIEVRCLAVSTHYIANLISDALVICPPVALGKGLVMQVVVCKVLLDYDCVVVRIANFGAVSLKGENIDNWCCYLHCSINVLAAQSRA